MLTELKHLAVYHWALILMGIYIILGMKLFIRYIKEIKNINND